MLFAMCISSCLDTGASRERERERGIEREREGEKEREREKEGERERRREGERWREGEGERESLRSLLFARYISSCLDTGWSRERENRQVLQVL